jgi:8-oxo-dGTP pyrophosphatase MutT (NUDIX family)
MSNPYFREIAAALLIDASCNLLLQRRDNIPDIIQPRKVGLFGGHREGEETFLECVVREITEEISQHIPADRFQHLFSLDGADPERPGGYLRGGVFRCLRCSDRRLSDYRRQTFDSSSRRHLEDGSGADSINSTSAERLHKPSDRSSLIRSGE